MENLYKHIHTSEFKNLISQLIHDLDNNKHPDMSQYIYDSFLTKHSKFYLINKNINTVTCSHYTYSPQFFEYLEKYYDLTNVKKSYKYEKRSEYKQPITNKESILYGFELVFYKHKLYIQSVDNVLCSIL